MAFTANLASVPCIVSWVLFLTSSASRIPHVVLAGGFIVIVRRSAATTFSPCRSVFRSKHTLLRSSADDAEAEPGDAPHLILGWLAPTWVLVGRPLRPGYAT